MGAMGFGSSCAKYLLFIFNFLFALGGLALAILGGLSLYNLKHIKEVSGSVQTYPAILLAAGVIIFVIAFYGCCGAVKESNCMLITFAVLLLTMVVLEVAVAAAIFLNKDNLKDEIAKGVSRLYDQSDEATSKTTIDIIQKAFKCCGKSGPIQNAFGGALPASCCDSPPCSAINQYTRGCVDTVRDYIADHSQYLGYVAIAVAVIELLEVCFALGLASSIRSADRRY